MSATVSFTLHGAIEKDWRVMQVSPNCLGGPTILTNPNMPDVYLPENLVHALFQDKPVSIHFLGPVAPPIDAKLTVTAYDQGKLSLAINGVRNPVTNIWMMAQIALEQNEIDGLTWSENPARFSIVLNAGRLPHGFFH